MIVSWNWLKEYVLLDMPAAELASRLMMAGLNHESTAEVGGDLAIDLEVTSNRPDCLGHLGIAREIAVLWDRELKVPAAAPRETGPAIDSLTSVELECPELCSRYMARVLRGVRPGPSPQWLVRRLATLGIPAINNVVDVTNYVLFECGQPLHAFDLDALEGQRIVVRAARPGEELVAIDHKSYLLAQPAAPSQGMAPEAAVCVIADSKRPVAIGGVMGGAATEVTARTKNVMLEAAQFNPQSIRTTVRRLNLHSASSFRFERGLDPGGVDWASRRACALILELAGGELATGAIDVGGPARGHESVRLRLSQLARVLGITIEPGEVRRILAALGNTVSSFDDGSVTVVPPTWRRDLTREIDLVEEVARIHGYDAIPEDVSVPMARSSRSAQDRLLSGLRHVLTGTGFDEAITVSVVDSELSEAFSPWTNAPALTCSTPLLRRADHLRRSLVPSLLAARRTNETLGNSRIELFELARAYLPRSGQLPDEELLLALTSGGDFYDVKGAIEAVVASANPDLQVELAPWEHDLFESDRGVELYLRNPTGQNPVLGYLGEVSAAGRSQFDLRGSTTVAELRLASLFGAAKLVRTYREVPAHPATTRDINLEVPEAVQWGQIAHHVRECGGALLETLEFREIYRDPILNAAGRKSMLFGITLRDPVATLTSQQADRIRDNIVAQCQRELGATLRG